MTVKWADFYLHFYKINLDEYADTGTHWIALFCNRNEIVYFDSFGVEHIPEEIYWE